MVVRELFTRLGFQADNSGARQHESALRSVRRAAVKLTAAYTATVGAAGALAVKMAGTTDELSKSATEAGLTTQKYQDLSFALSQVAGTAKQESDRALGRLNQRIGRARREGGKYADALVDMGFSQERVANGAISTSEAMDALTQKLGKAKDAQDAAAIAGDLLGTRIGRRLGPAIYENSQALAEQQKRAEELGGGWSDLAVKSGVKLTGRMGELSQIMTTVSSVLAEQLVPATNRVVGAFVDWFAANKDLVLQDIGFFLRGLASVIGSVADIVTTLTGYADKAAESMGGWNRVIRLVTAALSGLVAVNLAGFIYEVVSEIASATAATGALEVALASLQRLTVVGLLAALGLVIEDVVTWIAGGDSAIGKWIISFDKFSSVVKKVAKQVWDYIQPLVDQFRAVGEIYAGVFTLDVDRILQGFKDLGNAVMRWAKQVFGDIGGLISDAFTGFYRLFKPQIDAVLDYLQPVFDAFKAIGEIVAGVFTLDVSRIMEGFVDLGKAAWEWAKQVFGDIGGLISDAFTGFYRLFKPQIDAVLDYLQPVFDAFKAIGEIVAGVFTLDVSRIMEGFVDLGKAAWEWAKQVFGDIGGLLLSSLKPDIGAIMDSLADLGDRMLDWAGSLGKQISQSILPSWVQDKLGLGDDQPQETRQQKRQRERAESDTSGLGGYVTQRTDNRDQSSTTDNRDQSANSQSRSVDNRDQSSAVDARNQSRSIDARDQSTESRSPTTITRNESTDNSSQSSVRRSNVNQSTATDSRDQRRIISSIDRRDQSADSRDQSLDARDQSFDGRQYGGSRDQSRDMRDQSVSSRRSVDSRDQSDQSQRTSVTSRSTDARGQSTDARDQSDRSRRTSVVNQSTDARDQSRSQSTDARDQRIQQGEQRARQAADNARSMAAQSQAPAQTVQRNVSERHDSQTKNVNVRASVESTLQVPPGTSEEQKAAVKDQAERSFNELFDREIKRTLNDMPES